MAHVAILRAQAGRAPHDRNLSDLVGELSTRSQSFRGLWASHDIRDHRTGIKSIRHPVVGDLDLSYEALDVTSERGLLLSPTPRRREPPSSDALQLLANWSTTHADAADRSATEA